MSNDASSPEVSLAHGKRLLDEGEPQAARVVLENCLLLSETQQNPAIAVSVLGMLAACDSRLMRFDDAELAYDRAFRIASEMLEPGHWIRVLLICNRAAFERSRGALAREKQLWHLALPLLQGDARFARELRECLRCLEELETSGPEELRLRESLESSREADQSSHASFDERHASYEAVQRPAYELAALLAGMGRHREKSRTLRDGLIMRPEELWRRLVATRASGRSPLLDEQRCRFNLFLDRVLQDMRPEPAQTALETLLWRRGIGLEIHRCANRLARRDPEVREVLDTLRFIRANYASVLFEAPPDAELRGSHGLKVALEPIEQDFEYQTLEARLLERLEPHVNRFVSRPADCAELASRIPGGGLLVEYWRCTRPNGRGSVAASYVALVLFANRPDKARVIHLCETAELEEVLIEYLALLSGRSKTADIANVDGAPRNPVKARELGQRLRTLLLDPLEPWTSRAQHLLLVTDGFLSRLPFSTLPLGDGYVMDHWLISYLHTARDLFGSDDTTEPPGSSVVISDPAYDWPGSFEEGRFRFDPLECAAREGEAIGHLLGVEPLTGMEATKNALATCRSPEILHIATHGMLLPASPSLADLGPISPLVWRDAGEARLQIAGLAVLTQGLGRLSGRQLPDQALRSILALAGVNTWLDGHSLPDAAGNGLVSAEDIAAMDLTSNRLTVLSACETGLGVIGIGEGVLGLRSSFMLAGAETIVTSLWEVNDESTEELMRTFYQNLIQQRMGRAEALQEAQDAIREQYPDDPYYWGPFISHGVIAPLRP